MKKILIAAVACLILNACTATPEQSFKVKDFTDEPQIDLAAGDINIQSVVVRNDRAPHMEYKMPMRPEEALYTWANNRYTALSMSSPTTAKIVIRDASMTEEMQPADNWYTYDNVKYRLAYDVAVQFEKNGVVVHAQEVAGWEEASIPQKSTINEKEKTWENMLNNMVTKVDAKVNADIPSDFIL